MVRLPNQIDAYVGSRVRMRRLMLKMSQAALADGLGIVPQQLQKYETAVNRLSAGRLQQIADILDVPVSFFFDGASNAPRTRTEQANSSLTDLSKYFSSRQGLALAQAFGTVRSIKLRRLVVSLAEELARHERAQNAPRSKASKFSR